MIQEETLRTITCPHCKHMTLYSEQEAIRIYNELKENNDEGFKCELCYVPKGTVKVVKFYEQCGKCLQVYDRKNAMCFCDEPTKSSIRFTIDPKGVWRKNKNVREERIKDEIEISKAETKVKRKIRNYHEAKDVREELNTNLLKKICVLLENQALPHENKVGKLDAIQ